MTKGEGNMDQERTRFIVVDSTTGAQVERMTSIIQARSMVSWMERLTHRPHHLVSVLPMVVA